MNPRTLATSALLTIFTLVLCSLCACNRPNASSEEGGTPDTAGFATPQAPALEKSLGPPSVAAQVEPASSNVAGKQAPPSPARSKVALHALTVSNPRVLRDLDLREVSRLELTLHPDDTATRLAAGLSPPPEDACSALDLWMLAERATSLTHLTISGCGDRLRAGFGALGNRIQTLRISDLEVDPVLAGRLAEMTSLVEISLSRFTVKNHVAVSVALAPASFSAVTLLEAPTHAIQILRSVSPRIQRLRLEGAWVTPDTLRDLSILHRIRALSLIGTGVTNAGLANVQRLKSLASLELEEESVNDLSPLYLRELPLTSLTCRCDKLGDTGARHLAKLSSLQRLTLEGSRLSPDGVQSLAKLTTLTELKLTIEAITSVAIDSIATLPGLERLWVESSGPRNASFAGLASAEKLRSLTLRIPELDDALIPTINRLQNLHVLDLRGTSISDRGLLRLTSLPKLQRLNLGGTRVSRSGFQSIGALGALESLDLSSTDVVDEAIRALSPLHHLRSLNLRGTLVTSDSLEILALMASLEGLDTQHTAIPESQVTARLPTVLPNATYTPSTAQ